jgi:hypothetical protein
MKDNPIRIFREGKGTRTRLNFKTGEGRGMIIAEGAGSFLGTEFETQKEARAFCDAKLARDPSSVLYIVSGIEILEIVLNRHYHRTRERRSNFLYVVTSMAGVFAVALLLSVFVMPFNSLLARSLFTGGMTLLYALGLILQGTRNFDALIIMAIIFILLTILFFHP